MKQHLTIRSTKDDRTFVFCEIVYENDGDFTEPPSLNFNFGSADPTQMNYLELGRIIATAKKHTVEIWGMTQDNLDKKNYRAYLDKNTQIQCFTDWFAIEEEVDFEKYRI